ncbi:MAG: methyl-accepting chemotaxis protein [Treponema sp.]|jgi:methyl-accepting chemotaxis protein|nr:methyl-accepting chemotaxis protein [Treponema sp.]
MKFFKSLKARFIILFILFIVILCTVLTIFAVSETISTVSEVFAQQGIFITEKAASIIDGDAFERLTKSLDEADPYYKKTQLELLAIKNDNRCMYLYTMAPFQGSIYQYIIDGSAPIGDPEDFSALGDQEDAADYDKAFHRCWIEKSSTISGLQNQEGWGWMISIYTPILNSRSDMVGIVGCDFDGEDLYAELRSHVIRLVILALCFLAAGLGIMIFFLKLIFSPIKTINTILKDISEGEGDLTHTITVNTQDEVGDLALFFNKTLGHISALISQIKYKVNALTNTGHELNVNMSKTSLVVRELMASSDEMKAVKSQQEISATEAGKAVKNIHANIDSLNKLVEEQSGSVETSSSAIEEMIANINSVTKTLMENIKNVEQLSGASENGKTGLQTVAEKIQEIAKDSEGLLEINLVMKKIASQTNLLSMNAAIEAAHAGESGKGFAVVADEIRKLAESSEEQSKTTAAMLKKIKSSIDSITASSNEVLSRFAVIDTGVKTVSQHEQNILSAMEEQEVGGQQLLKSIARLKELSVSVEKGSGDMRVTGDHLIKQTNELISTSNDAINGMNQMLDGAIRQIQTAVSQVDEMSAENSKNFEDLKKETNKFKVSSSDEKKKILLVDDDKVYLGIASSILKKEYEVIAVESGEEALHLFYQGLTPNLVLLDLMMPNMDGWDAFERIRRIGKLHNTPIAICSSSDTPENIAQAKKIGAVDFIQKPCKDLMIRVKKLL